MKNLTKKFESLMDNLETKFNSSIEGLGDSMFDNKAIDKVIGTLLTGGTVYMTVILVSHIIKLIF